VPVDTLGAPGGRLSLSAVEAHLAAAGVDVEEDGPDAIAFPCPVPGHNQHRARARQLKGGKIVLGCEEAGHIWEAIGLSPTNGTSPITPKQAAAPRQAPPDKPKAHAAATITPPPRQRPPERQQTALAPSPAPIADILRRVPPQNLEAEESVLGAIFLEVEAYWRVRAIVSEGDFYRESHRLIWRAMAQILDQGIGTVDHPNGPFIDGVLLADVLKQYEVLDQVGGPAYLSELAARVPTASNAEYYARIVHDAAGKRRLASIFTGLASEAYNGVSLDALIGEAERQLKPVLTGDAAPGEVIISENYDVAVEANAEYLQRRPIIDRLGYTQSIALAVGGKHHGKTTNVRTVALSVMKGLPVWGRETEQGHVIYVASDDEIASTRMELLRMGWNGRTDPLTLVHIKPGMAAEPERVLEAVAKLANRTKSVLIILDMLFDFARIRDEMSYAQTREAIGKVQTLAQVSGTFVLATHHSPKYMPDAMTAATAALGSQGIAARFSPIILTRKWADGLYTVESTMTRDPRGLALPPTVITINENGWAETSEPFKSWMKWRVYAPRVLALFEGLEPGMTRTVQGVATELDIPRPEAQNTLYRLFLEGELKREWRKRSLHYWLDKQEEIFTPREDRTPD